MANTATLSILDAAKQTEDKYIQLLDITEGDTFVISKIDELCLEVDLLKMGVGIGDLCRLSSVAPFGDPIAITVNHTKIALRKRDAAAILVQKISL